LHTTARLEPSFKTAFHLASTQARYALERHAWAEAMQLEPRQPASLDWDRYPWAEAVTRFARGLGAAHLNKIKEAQREAERLNELETNTQKIGEDLFARNIRMLRLQMNSWIAHVEGHEDQSLSLMREAADLEATTPKHAVTPGPTIPTQELLGDLLTEQRKPAEARAAYQRSLAQYPNRLNSLKGAKRELKQLKSRG
jgi:tetratricopeptide (TPR) repeat protein